MYGSLFDLKDVMAAVGWFLGGLIALGAIIGLIWYGMRGSREKIRKNDERMLDNLIKEKAAWEVNKEFLLDEITVLRTVRDKNLDKLQIAQEDCDNFKRQRNELQRRLDELKGNQ